MRISTGMIFDAGISAINNQTAALLHTQQQVSSGRRILTPADDPVAAARALDVTQAKDITAQYASNQDSAKSALGLEDAQLSGVSDLLARVKELTVQAGNASLNSTDRKAIAVELRARFSELLGIANSQDSSGQYLFSGYMGSTLAFSGTVDTGVTYKGDNGQLKLQLSASQQLQVSDSGNDVFNRIANGNGYFATTYAGGNAGDASIDTGTVSDPTKWNSAGNSGQYEVRFATGISSVTGSVPVSAGIPGIAAGNNQFSISVNGGGPTPITIPATAGSFGPADLAQLQLNINGAIGAGVAGVSVNASGKLTVTASTGVSVVIGAVGGDTGMASIFGTPTTLPPATLYDIVDVAAGANNGKSVFSGAASSVLGGSYSHAYTAGQPISFSGMSLYGVATDFGASVTVAGTPANGDSFTVSSGSQSAFKTMKDLIVSLESSSTATVAGSAKFTMDINAALANIDQVDSNILRVRAGIGSRLNEIDSLASVTSDVNLQYQQTLSNLQDVDYAKSISDLTRMQTQLDAAQKSFLKVSQMSIFNFI